MFGLMLIDVYFKSNQLFIFVVNLHESNRQSIQILLFDYL